MGAFYWWGGRQQLWPNVEYAKQALMYAQTAYFVAVLLTQWTNLLICKTRKLSIFEQVRTAGDWARFGGPSCKMKVRSRCGHGVFSFKALPALLGWSKTRLSAYLFSQIADPFALLSIRYSSRESGLIRVNKTLRPVS